MGRAAAIAESLTKQLGPQGIRVNGVAPGPNWTPLQVSGARRRRGIASSAPRLCSVGRDSDTPPIIKT